MFMVVIFYIIVVATMIAAVALAVSMPFIVWDLLRSTKLPNTATVSQEDVIQVGEKRMQLYREFSEANHKRYEDNGPLREHVLRIMQQNSDEFNEIAGHEARIQFILEILEFKSEFADQNDFQKAFNAAMNMYVPGEMKKRTGKGGLGMTYSGLSLNEEFAKAKEQWKMLAKA